ncbi:MAG TPA: DNA replication protein, partial [Alphaproteobacteria bacterium]|nr:DNA replication protein [Alphaproteobacteria bacterium]
ESPAKWGLSLPDLITRLKAVPRVAIGEPDETLLNALLLKQFVDRQLTVAPDVIAYLTKNMERSFKAVSFVVKRA